MKRFIIFILSCITIFLTVKTSLLIKRLNAAQEYITALEDAFPEYIDTVSGCDEYSNWYN